MPGKRTRKPLAPDKARSYWSARDASLALPYFLNLLCPTSYATPTTNHPTYPADDTTSSIYTPLTREVSVRKALNGPTRDKAAPAVAKELTKVFTLYDALELFDYSKRDHDAVLIHSRMLIKDKYHGDGSYDKTSARLAAGGNTQPSDSYVDTFAPTVDETLNKLIVAAFFADAVKNNYLQDMVMCDFDVPGAFLNVPLDRKSCPRQILMRLQPDLPHPFAGKWCLVKKGLYGLKQSNALFAADLKAQFLKAGFLPSEADPCVYIKVSPTDPTRKCIVSMHVDDGQVVHNSPQLYQDLVTVLEERYGPLTHNASTTSYLGQNIKVDSTTGRVTYNMEGYIKRFLQEYNITGTSPSPSDDTLFQPPTNLAPVNQKDYQRIIGGLIYCLKTRHDIRKEVVHLSSRCSSPTVSDLSKAIRVLRYLNFTPTLGPSYYTDEGPVLTAHVDASYGVHSDGSSQSGFYLSIGRHSAPIHCHAAAQRSCVSSSSMEAEYVALSSCGKRIAHYRHFLETIGFAQDNPTIIYEDNQSAINLAQAPEIPRKSRHIHVRHHYIRRLVQDKLVKIVHLPTTSMVADMLTKPLPIRQFLHFSQLLLNTLPSTP